MTAKGDGALRMSLDVPNAAAVVAWNDVQRLAQALGLVDIPDVPCSSVGTRRLDDVLVWGTRLIRAFLPQSPRLDAEVIVGGLWCKEPIFIMAYPEAPMPDSVWEKVRLAVLKRCLGVPVAYLVGYKDFYGYRFEVNEHTLIPRPETELLVEWAVQRCRGGAVESGNRLAGQNGSGVGKQLLGSKSQQSPWRVLDLCTGSGNVACSVALQVPFAEVWAQDIAPEALEIAQNNARKLGCSARMHFVAGDLCALIPEHIRFQVIVANPPYIATDGSLPPEENVARYEPSRALFAGNDGLEVIRRLVEQARHFLVSGGCLAIEIGCDQSEKVSALLREGGYEDIAVTQDLRDLPRMVSAKFCQTLSLRRR